MTSEVLILNKRAVVLAADSAVTSSGGEHPRYSKSANKIFDLSQGGSVAAAVFGGALIDLVPWELAIKLFRSHLGGASFPKAGDYLNALTTFLSSNDRLFPPTLRASFVEEQFDRAVLLVVQQAQNLDPVIVDLATPLVDRQARWAVASTNLRNQLNQLGVAASLSAACRDVAVAEPIWAQRAAEQLAQVPTLDAIEAHVLAELAHHVRYSRPDLLLGESGLVVAGYGEEEIFPSFKQVNVYGHVGSELFFSNVRDFEVTHQGIAMIQPLAQTSMIDVFTDGFGSPLEKIIDNASRSALSKMLSELAAQGVHVPEATGLSIANSLHSEFMTDWKKQNWKQNFNPLVGVIATLDVEEMAHLAETLLVLESLKERVTSPSESVGGPIDVAVITKSEGLVWTKRKHYFASDLNMRYSARVQRSLHPVKVT